jgi:gliding motility-associated-like protein
MHSDLSSLMKKAAAILPILLDAMALVAQHPDFRWATQIESNDFVYSTSIATDAYSNVYTTGYFTGSVDFDPGPGVSQLTSSGATDIFIHKANASGNLAWARKIGGAQPESIFSINVDGNGNVYTSGAFTGTVDFNPGAGTYNLTASTFQDMFICKLDALGNFIWAINIGGLSVDCAAFITTDASGNLFMTGNFTGVVDFDPGPGSHWLSTVDNSATDIFVLKLDASANFIWVKQIQTTDFNYVFELAVDNSGSVYVTGDFANSADFDPGAGETLLTSAGGYDAYIFKLDSDGNFEWAISFGSAGFDGGVSITVDGSGNVYSTGGFSNTVDFDPGPGVFYLHELAGKYVFYIMKLDASGNLIWAKKIGNEYSVIRSIKSDGSGDVYITGYFFGTIDFDPAGDSDNLVSVEQDMFIAKFAADGEFEWSRQVSGPGHDYAEDMAIDGNGNMYVSGIFHGTADFDPGADNFPLTSTGQGDVYILKMSQCKNVTTSEISVSQCKDYTLNNQRYETSGIYSQTIPNTMGCDSIITLNLTITGVIQTSVTYNICEGESYEGHSRAGTYVDSFASANGCDSIRTLSLSVLAKPLPYLGADIILCHGDSISLHPGEFDAYTWQDGSVQDRFVVNEPGTYNVNVQNVCGTATDEIVIKAAACGINFPSAFSPNNDGLNDVFRTNAGNNFSRFNLTVYNRWGQKVFETADPSAGWDGKVKGTEQTIGSFVWICVYTDRSTGVSGSARGTVTIVK